MRRSLALALVAGIPTIATSLNATTDAGHLATGDVNILCGVDLIGTENRFTRFAAPRALDCPSVSHYQLNSAAWTSYNGGTSWLKSRASVRVAKAGATSAFIARPLSGTQQCPTA